MQHRLTQELNNSQKKISILMDENNNLKKRCNELQNSVNLHISHQGGWIKKIQETEIRLSQSSM